LRTVILYSGGKDSTYALWCALHQGWDVVTLLTMLPRSPESWMFHYPNVRWCALQAEAMGLPLVMCETQGVKEEELEDLRAVLEDLKELYELDAVVSGAVASDYQKARVDHVCEDLGLRTFAPLWHKRPLALVQEVIEAGFKPILTGCSALGFRREWLGRPVDEGFLKEVGQLAMRYGVHAAFEGGEAETFVLDGPIFREALQVVDAVVVWDGQAGYLAIKEMRKERKDRGAGSAGT